MSSFIGEVRGEVQTEKEALIETALRRGEGYNAIAKELRVSAKTIAKVSKRLYEISPVQALEMFEKGISPMEIVRRYHIEPKIVAEWCAAWVSMNDSWEVGQKYVKEETGTHEESEEEDEKTKEERIKRFQDVLKKGRS